MLRVALPLHPFLARSLSALALLVSVSVFGTSVWATGPAGLPTTASVGAQQKKPTATASGTPNAVASPGSEDTDAQLKKAVSDSEKQLGTLDPQQKKIFDEEVVPQFAFFVKDYSKVGNNVSVQVDVDAIKNNLGFSAAKNIPTGTTNLLLYFKADPHCPKCVEASTAIKKSMQARAERRGFVPVWISPEELVDTKPLELAEKRNASGALVVELKPAPMDDVDSAHADEKRFINSCAFDIRGLLHHEDQSEIYDTDSFELTSAKLLTQAFVELGTKTATSGANAAASQELLIQLSGTQNFQTYTQLKNQIRARLKDMGVVEERKISRGRAVLAIKTGHSLDELKLALGGIQFGGALVAVTGAHSGPEGQIVEMEIK